MERKISSGSCTFLVKDPDLKNFWDASLIKWLKANGFEIWDSHGFYPMVDWVFINLNSKIYAPGMPGVCITPYVGRHAITRNEFMQIYKIYKKYEGLDPLEFDE